MATATSEDDEEVATEEATPGIVLKKSSSRDYSRVMCETLTYVEDKSARNKMERQGSIRNGSSSARYVAASKRGYFGYHLWGCFPSRSRRSSLHLIPKLVLAPDGGAVSEISRSMVKCGSSKGGPAFSRVPADAARGSYSEPTSPQVTCIGQVKSKSNNKNKPGRPVANAHSNKNSNAVLLRSRSSARKSVSSPLASPARFARSNSNKRGDRLLPCSTAPTRPPYSQESSSYEIDLTCNVDDSNNNSNTNQEEEAAALSSGSQQEEHDMRVARRSSADQEGEDGSKAREVHRQLAMEVCQALAAASSAITPPYHQQQLDQEHEEEACTVALVDLTLKRLDSLRPSSVVDDPSPGACLWMRRSIARPIALDLARKHRSKA